MKCTVENTIVVSVADWQDNVAERTKQFTNSCDYFGWPLRYLSSGNKYPNHTDGKFLPIIKNTDSLKNQGIEYAVWLDCADSVVVEPWETFIWKLSMIDIPKSSLFTGSLVHPYSGYHFCTYQIDDVYYKNGGYAFVGHLDAWAATYDLMCAVWKDSYNPAETSRYARLIWTKIPNDNVGETQRRWIRMKADDTLMQYVNAVVPKQCIPDAMKFIFGRTRQTNPEITLDELRNPHEDWNMSVGGASTIHLDKGKTGEPMGKWFETHFTKNNQSTERRKLALEILEINITNVCNLKCTSCAHFSWLLPQVHPPIERLMEQITAWSEKLSVKTIRLQGGECTLYPQLEDIVSHVKTAFNDPQIEIWTNGITLEQGPPLSPGKYPKVRYSVSLHNDRTVVHPSVPVVRIHQRQAHELRYTVEDGKPVPIRKPGQCVSMQKVLYNNRLYHCQNTAFMVNDFNDIYQCDYSPATLRMPHEELDIWAQQRCRHLNGNACRICNNPADTKVFADSSMCKERQ